MEEFRRTDRRYERSHNANGDDRSPFQKDRDRILYASAFQRLAEVTQVVTASSGYVFHNRLTHSLQVAQVGRRLAEKLLLLPAVTQDTNLAWINPDVVETACLAHDLGHPPFGHAVEEELNILTRDHGGFEGNAQSFRILCRLAFQSIEHRGLDLTRATLSINPQFRDEVMMLKELIWTYVIQNPALATQQLGQRHMIQKIFTVYASEAVSPAKSKIFPAYYRERLRQTQSETEQIRICADLIAGLTENQVHRIYNRLTGSSSESSLNDPLG